MTKILLIRHALTDSVGKYLSGRTPGVYLNETGRKQAYELAECLTSYPISAVYSSPLERAIETAESIAGIHNLNVITSDNFTEIDFGNWTNTSIESLSNDSYFHYFNTFRSNTRIPGGETMLEAQLRIVKGLQKLSIQNLNKTVAVVSHADLIKSAIAYYTGIPIDLMQRLEISPASVSILEFFEDTVGLSLLNYTGKL
jgi:probable phosphoglycerate mutase